MQGCTCQAGLVWQKGKGEKKDKGNRVRGVWCSAC